MLNLPFAALFLAAEEDRELFMPTYWFGILMFALLMFILLVTVAFANKGRELPAEEHHDH